MQTFFFLFYHGSDEQNPERTSALIQGGTLWTSELAAILLLQHQCSLLDREPRTRDSSFPVGSSALQNALFRFIDISVQHRRLPLSTIDNVD